jgi:hypothetical protein
MQIDKWLAKHDYPRLTLPVVCGYIPLTRHLTSSFLVTPTAPVSAESQE